MDVRVLVIATLSALLLLQGCAHHMDASTPTAEIVLNNPHTSAHVIQEPVDAYQASELLKAPHKLGFTWYVNHPNAVYMIPSVYNIKSITGLDFQIGGQLIKAKPVTAVTDMDMVNITSSRPFTVTYWEFIRIFSAPRVQMRIHDVDGYSVSTFGPALKTEVNRKAVGFVRQIHTIKKR